MTSLNKLQPFFAHYIGFDEEAHAIFPLSFSGSKAQPTGSVPLLLVGTNRGRCLLFSLDTMKLLTIIHEDADKRQIVEIGKWPLDEQRNREKRHLAEEFVKEEDNQEPCCSTLSHSSSPLIWLHYRCSAIALFKLLSGDEHPEMFRFSLLRELNTGHYGFCHAFADSIGGRMFIPDQEEMNSAIRIRHRNGAEKMLVLGEEFMCRNWNRRRAEEEGEESKPDGMFKGIVMGMQLILDQPQHLLLAFEDSTMCAFDLHSKQVLDALKHPKHPELLCWSPATASCPEGVVLIALSVVGQVYLLSYESRKGRLRAECKVKKCRSGSECTAIALSPPLESVIKLALGFKNGVIEIHSVLAPSSPAIDGCIGWTTQPIACCTNFHSGPIRVLCWVKSADDNPEENDQKINTRSRTIVLVLCSGAADGKFSAFLLP